MSLTTTVLFDRPQKEIASLIQARLAACETAKIVTGFATPDGLAAIAGPIKTRPSILSTLIVGAGTYPAFEALDGLLAAGVSPSSLFIHLGHTAKTTSKTNPFARYRPMLHSKIYYFEMPDGTASAFIGSNNLTSFALQGLNGEASVLLEGCKLEPAFGEIREHIAEAQAQAMPYVSSMKTAYAFWYREYLNGLFAEINEPRDITSGRTILIFAESAKGSDPRAGDMVFFEIPKGIEQLERLKSQVHLFLFDTLPASPAIALAQAAVCKRRFLCRVHGLADKQGFKELPANWKILDSTHPVFENIPTGTFRPVTPKNMQQVQAEVSGKLDAVPEYVWDQNVTQWEPIYKQDHKTSLELRQKDGQPAIETRWHLVIGLRPAAKKSKEKDQLFLDLVAPTSNSYTLVSTGIRKIKIEHGPDLFSR